MNTQAARILISITSSVAITFIASTTSYAVPSPQTNEWFALGSGCRAKNDIPGNVTQEVIADPPGYPGYQRIRFHFKNFQLDASAKQSEHRDYGRECSVRLKVVPSDKTKITDVIAKTSLQIQKPANLPLTLSNQLKLGNTVIDELISDLAASSQTETTTSAKKEMAVELSASEKSPKKIHPSLAALKCGEPKIVGYDYTWIVKNNDTEKNRSRDDVNLLVEIGKDRILDLYVKTSPCKGPQFAGKEPEAQKAVTKTKEGAL